MIHGRILKPNVLQQENELELLELTPDLLNDVGLRILTAYSQTTSHDAANAAGSYAYFAAVRAMRDILCPKGWSMARKANLEVIMNSEVSISILVSSGDKYTGREDREPSTKNSKGNQTKKIVYANAKNPYLFPEMNKAFQVNPGSTPTWFLLYHVDTKKSQMRMELSLPTSFDANDLKVHGWMRRIILSSIDFNRTQIEIEQDFAPAVEFEIRRKSNE